MHTLALDLATRTGKAWADPGMPPFFEAVNLRPKGKKGKAFTHADIFAALRASLALHVAIAGPPAQIIYEEVSARSAKGHAAVLLFGLRGVLLEWAHSLKIPCRGVGPSQWKAALGIKGNAKKAHVRAHMQELGYFFTAKQQDECDALAILLTQTTLKGKRDAKAVSTSRRRRAVSRKPIIRRRRTVARKRAA